MEKKELSALFEKAYQISIAVSVVFLFLLVIFVLAKDNVYACYEKKTEITPIIAEGCGNKICDLNEYQDFLIKGKNVCIDCFLMPHCRIMDFNALNGQYFVDWNGEQRWVPKILNFCQIETKDNPFLVGEIEYSWDGEFSHFGLAPEEKYRCKTLSEILKKPN